MSLTALTAPNGGLAHALANTLQTLDGDPTDAVVVTSDLQRAHETAVAIATRFDLPLLTDPRLREMHFGNWDGRNWHELEITEGAALREWMAQWTRHAPPGGETVADLVARMESALEAFGTLPATRWWWCRTRPDSRGCASSAAFPTRRCSTSRWTISA